VSFEFTKTIDHSLYPRTALADARQAYRDYCTLKILPQNNDCARVLITVNDSYDHEHRQVVLDFFNYLLDKSVQILLEEDSD
jgi:hypothetical protein